MVKNNLINEEYFKIKIKTELDYESSFIIKKYTELSEDSINLK